MTIPIPEVYEADEIFDIPVKTSPRLFTNKNNVSLEQTEKWFWEEDGKIGVKIRKSYTGRSRMR